MFRFVKQFHIFSAKSNHSKIFYLVTGSRTRVVTKFCPIYLRIFNSNAFECANIDYLSRSVIINHYKNFFKECNRNWAMLFYCSKPLKNLSAKNKNNAIQNVFQVFTKTFLSSYLLRLWFLWFLYKYRHVK